MAYGYKDYFELAERLANDQHADPLYRECCEDAMFAPYLRIVDEDGDGDGQVALFLKSDGKIEVRVVDHNGHHATVIVNRETLTDSLNRVSRDYIIVGGDNG